MGVGFGAGDKNIVGESSAWSGRSREMLFSRNVNQVVFDFVDHGDFVKFSTCLEGGEV